MSRPVLLQVADRAAPVRTRAKPLRVNRPGDSYEQEADRVAEHVSRGKSVAHWSISSLTCGAVQRQGGAQQPPAPMSTTDMLGKVAEAILATKEGKQAVQAIKADPRVKGATDFATSPAGIAIEGAAAVGVVAGLAKSHTPLPLQVPKLPLDFIHPGLGVKITYEGPVDKPTAASIVLSYEPETPKDKPKQTETEKYRAETARIAAEQEKFRAGMRVVSRGGSAPEKSVEDHAFEKWQMGKLSAIGNFGGPQPGMVWAPASPATKAFPADSPLKPEAQAGTAVPDQAPEDKKKEELPVQRKAQYAVDIYADPAVVEPVIRSSGRPLDDETRRYMETRIGFDFSKVRVHTDSRAAESAQTIGAGAYTVGNDVVFGAGRYAPGTMEGRRLLAHELTHTIQQGQAGRPASAECARPLAVGTKGDAFEAEANAIARAIDSPLFPGGHAGFPRHRPGMRKAAKRMLQKYEAFEHAQFGATGDIIATDVANRAFVYRVQKGELPKQIADKFGISEEDLIAANKEKMKAWKANTNPSQKVEGFNAGEEIVIPPRLTEAMKEALKTKELSLVVNGVTMTYGEGIAMGDFFESPEEMLAAPVAELNGLLERIRKERAAGKALDASEWDAATAGRPESKQFTSLAERNDTHFAPSDAALEPVSGKSTANHKAEWEKNHEKALTESQAGNKEKAEATNAFADHFLTDAFAAGHLFNRRDAVEIFEGGLPKTPKGDDFTPASKAVFDDVANQAFVGKVKDEFSKYETVTYEGVIFRPNIDSTSRFSTLLQKIHLKEPLKLEGAVVKGIHDRLNASGVEVENAKGEKWTLSGDGTLNAKSLEVGKKAVAQSQMNVLDVFKKIGALDLPGLFRKVWDFVPHPTAGKGQAEVKDAITEGVNPKSARLVGALVKLITDNYMLIISKLVAKGFLKKA